MQSRPVSAVDGVGVRKGEKKVAEQDESKNWLSNLTAYDPELGKAISGGGLNITYTHVQRKGVGLFRHKKQFFKNNTQVQEINIQKNIHLEKDEHDLKYMGRKVINYQIVPQSMMIRRQKGFMEKKKYE